MTNNRTSRNSPSLLFYSLALNLFFVGVFGAIGVRHYFPITSTSSPATSWTPAARIDRLAAVLPPADADKLHAVFNARQSTVEAARQEYRHTQDAVHAALRADPFDPNAVRTTMAQSRNARRGLEEALQDVIATAAAEMSGDGRRKLAEWPRNASSSNR